MLDPVTIPPGGLPPAGIYVNATRVTEDGMGNRTSEALLLPMPSPGGTLGWSDTSVAFYVVT